MDMEFRTNIVLKVFAEFVWYAMQLTVFEVLFLHTQQISGWTIYDVRVFMGCLFVVDVMYMILVHDNMDGVFQAVRNGMLDLYLAKPVNSQFMISMRKVSTTHFLNFFLVWGYLLWALWSSEKHFSSAQVLTFLLMLASGFMIMYSMRFMFATISVFTQDAGNINLVWYQFYKLSTRPDVIYPSMLRFFVLMVFPVAFFVSVPARTLVEGVDWRLGLAAPLLAGTLLYLSHRLWLTALRHYSSASS